MQNPNLDISAIHHCNQKLTSQMNSQDTGLSTRIQNKLFLQQRTKAILNKLPLEHLRILESMGPSVCASILACARLYTLIMYQESLPGSPGDPKEWFILDAPLPEHPKEDRCLLLSCRLLADELVCTNNTFPYIYHPKKMVVDMLGDEYLQTLLDERARAADMKVTLLTRHPKLGDIKYVERVDPVRSHVPETEYASLMKFQLFTSTEQARNLLGQDMATGTVQNRDWLALNSPNCSVTHSKNGGIQEFFQREYSKLDRQESSHSEAYRRYYIEGGTNFLVSYLKEMAANHQGASPTNTFPPLDTFLLTSRIDKEEQIYSLEELKKKRNLSFSNDLALTPELLASAGYVSVGHVASLDYPTARYTMAAYIYAGKGDHDSPVHRAYLANRVAQHEDIFSELQQLIQDRS